MLEPVSRLSLTAADHLDPRGVGMVLRVRTVAKLRVAEESLRLSLVFVATVVEQTALGLRCLLSREET